MGSRGPKTKYGFEPLLKGRPITVKARTLEHRHRVRVALYKWAASNRIEIVTVAEPGLLRVSRAPKKG